MALQTLERNWKTIRDEALAVMDQNTGLFIPEEENLREKGEWGQYTLWQQGTYTVTHTHTHTHTNTAVPTHLIAISYSCTGRKVGNSCQGVPKTCSLLERFPEATGCKRGQVHTHTHTHTHTQTHTH